MRSRSTVILIVSSLAGAGDFLAGLLLLVFPIETLQMMHVPLVAEPVWLQFVGVFVGCVGLSYGFGLLAWKKERSSARLKLVWELTSLFRLAVGTFVTIQIARNHLSPAWGSVPCTDFFWASLQLLLLRKGVFNDP